MEDFLEEVALELSLRDEEEILWDGNGNPGVGDLSENSCR